MAAGFVTVDQNKKAKAPGTKIQLIVEVVSHDRHHKRQYQWHNFYDVIPEPSKNRLMPKRIRYRRQMNKDYDNISEILVKHEQQILLSQSWCCEGCGGPPKSMEWSLNDAYPVRHLSHICYFVLCVPTCEAVECERYFDEVGIEEARKASVAMEMCRVCKYAGVLPWIYCPDHPDGLKYCSEECRHQDWQDGHKKEHMKK